MDEKAWMFFKILISKLSYHAACTEDSEWRLVICMESTEGIRKAIVKAYLECAVNAGLLRYNFLR